MPVPGTKETIFALLGMLAGGFGKGALMAQMARDKDIQDKKEAALKRKEALEDRAFEFLSAGYMDQTLPFGQREKFGEAISKALYGNLGGEEPTGPLSGFDFNQPYQMTPEENARQQMQDPTTFRALGKDMLKRDKKPEDDPYFSQRVKESDSRIRLNNQKLVNLKRKKDTTTQIKRIDPYTSKKYDLLIKRAEFVAKELKQYEGLSPGYREQSQDIIDELTEEMNQYLDDAEKLLITAEGGFDPSPYEIKPK